MTLEGVTVDEWLRSRPSDATEPASAVVAPQVARTPRLRRLQGSLIWCAAVAAGAWFAAPALSRRASCPPSGEGATWCHLEHNVLRATMTFLLVAAAVVVAARMIVGLPA